MCGIFGVMDKRRQVMDGSGIRQALSMMNERGSGEGAGYAAYGIYPDYQDCYALHVFFDNARESKAVVDATLEQWGQSSTTKRSPPTTSRTSGQPAPLALFLQA